MKNNKLLTVVFIVFCIIFLMKQCGKTNSQTNVSQNNEQSLFGKKEQTIPADEVHKFENYKSPKGVLDDDGIYRYKFLDEDDSVYDAMSYQEVDTILPIHEQKPINVTLGTNFTINSHNFNLYDKTYKEIIELVSELDFETATAGAPLTPLRNGETGSGIIAGEILFKNHDEPLVDISAGTVNTGKREIDGEDGTIFSFSISDNSDFSGNYASYEGINLGITRNQFLENVKINNPVLDSSLNFFDKSFNKELEYTEVTYLLDERINEKGEQSTVKFVFKNERLRSIGVVCTFDYLG
ncbi:TPA: hypothetical protein TVE62_001836, partial [Streptococcus equi subsp. zooepidemicus]|nr:hypothetical protein [Streptococcus equi subsp. zooepidemicus]